MAKYNPCFLTVIGDSLLNGHPVFPGVIEKNFPDYENAVNKLKEDLKEQTEKANKEKKNVEQQLDKG